MGSLDLGMKMTLWRDFQVPGILLKGLWSLLPWLSWTPWKYERTAKHLWESWIKTHAQLFQNIYVLWSVWRPLMDAVCILKSQMHTWSSEGLSSLRSYYKHCRKNRVMSRNHACHTWITMPTLQFAWFWLCRALVGEQFPGSFSDYDSARLRWGMDSGGHNRHAGWY